MEKYPPKMGKNGCSTCPDCNQVFKSSNHKQNYSRHAGAVHGKGREFCEADGISWDDIAGPCKPPSSPKAKPLTKSIPKRSHSETSDDGSSATAKKRVRHSSSSGRGGAKSVVEYQCFDCEIKFPTKQLHDDHDCECESEGEIKIEKEKPLAKGKV